MTFRSDSFFTPTEGEKAELEQVAKERHQLRLRLSETQAEQRIASLIQEVLDAHEADDQELLAQRLQELRACVES